MLSSTIRMNAHRSYVSVAATGRRQRRQTPVDSLLMRRISRVVEAPLDDVIALFDEFRVTDAPVSTIRTQASDDPIPETAPREETAARVEEQAVPMTEVPVEPPAEPIRETEPAPVEEPIATAAEAAAAKPAKTLSGPTPPVTETVAAEPAETTSEPTVTETAAEEPVETLSEPTPPVTETAAEEAAETTSEPKPTDRAAAMRAARRRLRAKSAAHAREPRTEEAPIFLDSPWTAEPEGFEDHEAFMARAAAALSLPEEPLLARMAYEQNRAVFLDEDELPAQDAAPQEAVPAEPEAETQAVTEPQADTAAEAAPTVQPEADATDEPAFVETDAAEEDEPPVREMIEEELEVESHISATGATVSVYRMYDVDAAAESAPTAQESTPPIETVSYAAEPEAEIEAEAYEIEETVEAEVIPYDAEADTEAFDDEPAIEVIEPEIESDGTSSALPARMTPWPWEESNDLSLEEALESLDDKELSGLTTEIVNNTVEGALEDGAIKSLCRRYSLRLQAVYNAIQRESKRRISRMTEKHHAPSAGSDATMELGMRMAKKLLTTHMRGKRTWFKSPWPEADGRYYIIQSHKVEDEKLPIDFPTECVYSREVGDGWAISVGY